MSPNEEPPSTATIQNFSALNGISMQKISTGLLAWVKLLVGDDIMIAISDDIWDKIMTKVIRVIWWNRVVIWMEGSVYFTNSIP